MDALSELRSVVPRLNADKTGRNGQHWTIAFSFLIPAAPDSVLYYVEWRRERDWFCFAKSPRDHLWCPISAALRRNISSLIRCANNLIWLCQMAEREGFEPSVPFPAHILSRDAQSATLSSLLLRLSKGSLILGQ